MSYRAMMRHRAILKRQTVDLDSGAGVYDYQVVKANVQCLIDLNFIRTGKDPMWTAEAGRPTERTGVAFFLAGEPIKAGDIIEMTRGPRGIFSLEAAVDEAWRPSKQHHLEVSIKEIPRQLVPQVDPGAPDNTPAPLPPGAVIPIPAVTPDQIGFL